MSFVLNLVLFFLFLIVIGVASLGLTFLPVVGLEALSKKLPWLKDSVENARLKHTK